MEVRQVRYFLESARTLNFTRAAELCHVSQPALTMAIKRLESELGAELFHREGRRIRLTQFGLDMLPYLSDFLIQSARIHEVAHRRINVVSAPLRLGVLSTIGPVRIARFLAHVESRIPGMELTVEEDTQETLWTRLASSELDVCIGSLMDDTPASFETINLYTERYVVVLPFGHELTNSSTVLLEQLSGKAYIDRLSCEFRETVKVMLDQRGIALYPRFRSSKEEWVQAMVLSGIGFAIMPEYSATHPDVVVRSLVEPQITRNIALHYLTTQRANPLITALANIAAGFGWPG